MNTIPQFLNEFLKSQYEENIAKNIINGYSKNRPITLRANTLKTNIDYIKNIFTKLNISYINVPWYSDALILKNISEEQLKNLDIYKNGFIYLQSLSSMIPPIILNPQENENILDMQGITEAISKYYYRSGESFDGLAVAPEYQAKFDRLAEEAINYYGN